MRSLIGYTRRHRLYNKDIRKQLNIFNIEDRAAENKERWIPQLNRMSAGKLAKEVCEYKPVGQRSIRSPRTVSYTHLDVYKRQVQKFYIRH